MIKVQNNNEVTAITACGYDIIKVVACGETVFDKTPAPVVLNMNWIDLGLPSGTLWADRNVGATGLTDAGYYFQWGGKTGYANTGNCQISVSKVYSDAPYYQSGGSTTPVYSKYNTTDQLEIIELSDDPCHDYFIDGYTHEQIPYGDGRGHSMTYAEFTELTANTTASTVTVDGVTCLRFSAQNGNHIDFPYCGYVLANSSTPNRRISACTQEADVKLGELYNNASGNIPAYARSVLLDSTVPQSGYTSAMQRYNLCPVRGCYKSPVTPVDLGLPSGTLWADMNIGAEDEFDAGLYFQWGDISGYTPDQCTGSTQPHKDFNSLDYKYYDVYDDEYTKYTHNDHITSLTASDDAATQLLGSQWTMPTYEQFEELIQYTTWQYVTDNNGMYYLFEGNGNSIIIPAGGALWSNQWTLAGLDFILWSKNRDALSGHENDKDAFVLNGWRGSEVSVQTEGRIEGCNIRGVISGNNNS